MNCQVNRFLSTDTEIVYAVAGFRFFGVNSIVWVDSRLQVPGVAGTIVSGQSTC